MRIILGISGASGAILGYEVLKVLTQKNVEVHLVVTESGIRTFKDETNLTMEQVYSLADYVYEDANIGALIASGSFKTAGMIVAPCSMKTLAAIAHGYNANLLVRAADVCLKENRKVVLVPREMPLNKTHVRNMGLVIDNGCTLLPPVMTFYNEANTIEKQLNHLVGKILMQFDLTSQTFVQWKGS